MIPKYIVAALAGGMVVFVFVSVFVSQGNVRHVQIFWKETIEATVAFKNIDGELKIVGIKGNGEINPTLVMRAGDYAYILTVINLDTIPHVFYVDGLEVHTKVLRSGENDTITLYSKNEGTYNYYDRFAAESPIGQIKAVKITSID